MFLNDREIRARIKDGLIKNYVDIDKQLTPQGFDLTTESVHSLLGSGTIDFSNEERRISETKEMEWKNNEIFLEKGLYKVVSREVIDLPDDLMGIAMTRSSLLRCGAVVQTSVWDAGFRGKSEFLLSVGENGLRLKKDARLVQLIFSRIEKVEKIYDGIYKQPK